MKKTIALFLALAITNAAHAQAPTINLIDPATTPGAARITPSVENAQVNAALQQLYSQEKADFGSTQNGAISSTLAPIPLTLGSQTYFANNLTSSTNLLRAKLGAFRAAIAAGSNTGSLRFLTIADSTWFGFIFGLATGGAVPSYYATSPYHVLTTMLRNAGWPAQDNAVFGLYGNAGLYPLINDSRITNVVGAANTSSPTVGGNLATFTGTGAGFWFAPTYAFDTYKVWYVASTTYGSCSFQAGTAAATTISTTGALSVQSITLSTGTTPGPATIKTAWVSGGACAVIGIEAWNSTITELRIIPAGWSGSSSVTWNNSNTPYAPIPMIAKLAPDFTTIALMINDWNAATIVPVATYSANIQAITNAALASGPVIYASEIPSAITAVPLATQANYVAAMYALAQTNKTPLIDLFDRWGSYETQSVLTPSLYSATIHGSAAGYADIAYMYFQFFNTL